MLLVDSSMRRMRVLSLAIVLVALCAAPPARATMGAGSRASMSAAALQAFAHANSGERAIQRSASRGGPHGNSPGVLPPQSHPFGLSYDEWAARWWQWAYSVPASTNPLFDESGANCGEGQSGPVWFLGGVFNVSGSATRDLCTVPSGKALFFPILNVEWDNFCPPIDPPLSVDELRATAAAYMNLAEDMSCEVDGQSIDNLTAYRTGGDPFAIDLPPASIWSVFGCDLAPGSHSPLVNDGYYLMLAPLSSGPHTIHFHGTVADPVNFTLDITYHLSVASGSSLTAGAAISSTSQDAAPAAAPRPSRTTWARLKAIYR